MPKEIKTAAAVLRNGNRKHRIFLISRSRRAVEGNCVPSSCSFTYIYIVFCSQSRNSEATFNSSSKIFFFTSFASSSSFSFSFFTEYSPNLFRFSVNYHARAGKYALKFRNILLLVFIFTYI